MLNLATVMKQYRWASKRTLRELGSEIGLPAATLMRLEQGYASDGPTFAKLIAWLLVDDGQSAQRSPAHAKRGKK